MSDFETFLGSGLRFSGTHPSCTLIDAATNEELGIELHFPQIPRVGETVHIWIDPIGTKTTYQRKTYNVLDIVHDVRVMRVSSQYTQNIVLFVTESKVKGGIYGCI